MYISYTFSLYIIYHKSLDIEQRPMIHYAIFFYFILYTHCICRRCCYIYSSPISFCTSVKSVCLPRDIGFSVGNECSHDLYNNKNLHCIICIFLYIHINFILFHVFIFFFHFYTCTTLRGSCKKS